MEIVLTGSLGHISKPLAIELLRSNQTVTIVSSDKNKKATIEEMGAKAAIGSVTDVSFMTDIFRGADVVYCMTPPDFSAPDQLAWYEKVAQSFADAIKASGVKRALYLSSYGAEIPSGTGFITGSYRAERILDALPNVWVTHIRPTSFYYNLFNMIGMIKAVGFIGNVYGGADKLAMVAPEDIALAISAEILRKDGYVKMRYVTSDDRTCNEIAQVLGKAIGKPDLKWNVLPPANVMKSLIANGIPANAAHNLVELGMAIHSGALRQDYQNNKPAFGNIRLEEFALAFADHYNTGNVQH
jgi:uncharacterized protein YbjT (DUF2867 family)